MPTNNDFVESLCHQIWDNEVFQNDFSWASTLNSQLFFQHYIDFSFDKTTQIAKLLQSASSFSLSINDSYRKAAYEIAVYVHNIISAIDSIDSPTKDYFGSIISLIFTRLGNFPADTMLKRNYENAYPSTLWFERELHKAENTVYISSKSGLVLTDFQANFWNAINHNQVVIVNAPTSAGKSFVLQNQIVSLICNRTVHNVLYIVPTRALIEQIILDIKTIFKKICYEYSNVLITEVPNNDILLENNIFVLTQERAQLLLENSVQLDLVVIDEAQNIADGSRGIILQSVIESAFSINSSTKLIFATPYVKNPDIFLSIFGLSKYQNIIIPEAESPVSQNIYSLCVNDCDFHTIYASKLDRSGQFKKVSNIISPIELSDESKLLATVPLCIGSNHNNIIYASEPSKCEKIASLISSSLSLISNEIDSELQEFSDFIKEHIHKNYLLAETIRHGVAYHYGNLPAFLRKGIERLCSSGKIRYIICTSTLLQGINLPAQNIFLLNPTKGHDLPLDGTDFWNLVGRAGRLMKDFEGNIFLINPQNWSTDPLSRFERKQIITSSFSKYICDSNEQLYQFIIDKNHKSGQTETQGLENTFMKLMILHYEGSLEKALDQLGNKISDSQKQKLIAAISDASDTLSLPYDIFSKNPSVSVYRQEEVYQYLKSRLANIDSIPMLIPPHPMQGGKAYGRINSLFCIYNQLFSKNNSTKQSRYFATLGMKWMCGASYSDLLQSRIEYKKKIRKRGSPNVNTEARSLFNDIETSLRFTYVKYSKCYNDILAYVLFESNNTRYIESIPPIHLFLELGASSKTMINLIGMGLSRTVAAQLEQHLINPNMSREDIKEWITITNLESIGLSDSALVEIYQL